MISSLYQYGLFDQAEGEQGAVNYVLSGFARALKADCLNFDEGMNGRERILSYAQLTPLNIAEPPTWEDIDRIVTENEIIIDANGRE